MRPRPGNRAARRAGLRAAYAVGTVHARIVAVYAWRIGLTARDRRRAHWRWVQDCRRQWAARVRAVGCLR